MAERSSRHIPTDRTGAWNYSYDSNQRLVGALPPAFNPVPSQPVGGPYTYDWVGNRTEPPYGETEADRLGYDEADRLLRWPRHLRALSVGRVRQPQFRARCA